MVPFGYALVRGRSPCHRPRSSASVAACTPLEVAQARNDLMIELGKPGLAEFGDVEVQGTKMSIFDAWLPPVGQQLLETFGLVVLRD